jgi:formyltetrahydrofolate synthetase
MDKDTLYHTIGKIAEEKYESLRSKMSDNTATKLDRAGEKMLAEIIALAKNRLTVAENEKLAEKGKDVWVERTSASHFPHIRLHGGALEDDPPEHNFDK